MFKQPIGDEMQNPKQFAVLGKISIYLPVQFQSRDIGPALKQELASPKGALIVGFGSAHRSGDRRSPFLQVEPFRLRR